MYIGYCREAASLALRGQLVYLLIGYGGGQVGGIRELNRFNVILVYSEATRRAADAQPVEISHRRIIDVLVIYPLHFVHLQLALQFEGHQFTR